MEILEAINLIEDYSLDFEQEIKIVKIKDRIKFNQYIHNDTLHSITSDMQYLKSLINNYLTLIKVVLGEEKAKEFYSTLNVIKEYELSILLMKKLNE